MNRAEQRQNLIAEKNKIKLKQEGKKTISTNLMFKCLVGEEFLSSGELCQTCMLSTPH